MKTYSIAIVNTETFITLNGYRIRFDNPILVSYILNIYFTNYVRPLLALPTSEINQIKGVSRPALDDELTMKTYKRELSVQIFWYDLNATSSGNEDARKTRELLSRNVKTVCFYANKQELFFNVYAAPAGSPIFLVISSIDVHDILKDLEQHNNVDSVFIFCSNVRACRFLKKQYRKIAGIFNRHKTLQDCIVSNLRRMYQQHAVQCLYANNGSFLCPLSYSFARTKLLFDMVTACDTNNNNHEDMIKYCHARYRCNKPSLEQIFRFEIQYVMTMDAVSHYTNDSFLYRCLNEALRTNNFYVIFIFRTVISELSSTLNKLHSDYCRHNYVANGRGKLTVYRGLVAPRREIEQLQANVGGLVGIIQYLSTTRDLSVAKMFACENVPLEPGNVSITFEIYIYPDVHEKHSIFADISRWSSMGEEEMLFNIGSIFKVKEVKCESIDANKWHVILESGKENVDETPCFQSLKQRSDELSRMRPDIALGHYLVDMGVSDKIDAYLHDCLKIRTYNDGRYADELQHTFIYQTLGKLYVLKRQPYQAIAYLKWAFDRFQASHQIVEAKETLGFLAKLASELLDPHKLLSIDQNTPIPFDFRADAYFRLEKNDEARRMYLELVQTLYASTDLDHLRLGESLTRLGRIDKKRSIFLEALEHYRQVLPDQHPYVLEVDDYLKKIPDAIDEVLPWIQASVVHERGKIKRKYVLQQSDKISQIKVFLQRDFGVPWTAQILQDENKRVLADDTATVTHYNLRDEIILYLTLHAEPEPRQIFVRTEISRIEIQIIGIHWWQSIHDIKCDLQKYPNVPPPQRQRLFEDGRELSDDSFCGKLKYPISRLLLAIRPPESSDESKNFFSFSVHLPLPTKSSQWRKPNINQARDTDTSNVMQDIFQFNRDYLPFTNTIKQVTVGDIKAMINQHRGIPIQFQQLMLEQSALTENTNKLADYGVMQGSILELQLVNIPIRLTFVVHNADRTDRFIIDSNETIEVLKNRIVKKMCRSGQTVTLMVSDKDLSPNHHSVLKAFPENESPDDRWETSLSVTVCDLRSQYCFGDARLLVSNQNQSIKLPLTSDLKSFKDLQGLISNKTHIAIDEQRVYADGQLVCKQQKLKQQKLSSIHVIKIVVFRKHSNTFPVKINVSGHTLLRLSLCSTTTTRDLKRMIKYLRDIPVKEQRLFVGRTELSNPDEIIQTLVSGRRIDVIPVDEKKIIFVHFKKRWILYNVDCWESVARLKARLQSTLSVSLDQYLLLHGNVALQLAICPFLRIEDKCELHLVRTRNHVDYIYVMDDGVTAIAACEWSSMTTTDDISKAIARLHRLPTVQPYRISDDLGPNSTITLIRLIMIWIIDTEKKGIMNLSIESRKTVLELKQELHLGIPAQRELIYQRKILSDEETLEKYENATILIRSVVSEVPDADPFDPLYIKRQSYYLDIEESLLRFDGSDDDAVKQYEQQREALEEAKRQAKHGD